MKCLLHEEKDAIGVCINCGKGLCSSCAIELGQKLYCNLCVNEEFNKINRSNEVEASFYWLPVLFGLVGGLFAYFINENFRKNRNRAKNMVNLGILVSIVHFYICIALWYDW